MKRMTNYCKSLVVLSAIGFWASPAVAQTFTTIDDPLGANTYPSGISGGNIVGYYTLTVSVMSVD